MKRIWMSGAAALMAVSVASVHAQSTGSQTPQTSAPQSQTSQQATASDTQTTTLRGCVYNEEAIPGRTPNVAERAGVMEDYIFVASAGSSMTGTSGATPATPPSATPPTGTPPATTPPTATPPSGTTPATPPAAAATGAMHSGKAYKLEKTSDDELKTLVGKMVEVTGKVDADNDTAPTGTSGTAGAAPDKSLGPDKIELPEFEVTSIRAVEGTCPATPSIRK